MFQGHQFIKLLNDNWVLDLTEFVGYKVTLDNDGNVKKYKETFQIILDTEDIIFEKSGRVPLKVLKEAAIQVRKHIEEFEEDRDESIW